MMCIITKTNLTVKEFHVNIPVKINVVELNVRKLLVELLQIFPRGLYMTHAPKCCVMLMLCHVSSGECARLPQG